MSKQTFIKELRLENFKSYREKTKLPLSPLTTLIGYNGSGKSSAILGLNLLSLLAKGKSLKPSSLRRNTKKPDFYFSPKYLTYLGEEYFKLGCTIEAESSWRNLDITFGVSSEGLTIQEERITNDKGEYLYRAEMTEDKEFKVHIQLLYPEEIVVENQHAVFMQLTKPELYKSRNLTINKDLLTIARKFRKRLSDIQFLYANLLDWNLSSYTRFKTLKEDGSNLSSVLYNLFEEQNLKEQILEFALEDPADVSIDLRFEKIQHNMVRVKQGSIPYFSEGQLRLLAAAAALYSAPNGSIVVFDDVDASIDAIGAQKLIKGIFQVANERNLQILLTSHSPALLNEIPIQAIPDVVFSFRKPEDGSSSLIQIDELNTYPELISRGPIGDLITSGVIKRYVLERKSNEQKKTDSLNWLKNFENREYRE